MSADSGSVERPTARGETSPSRSRAAGVAVAVILVAVNLRPAITSVGPLLDRARDSLEASATWAGLLTTIPVLCFAFAGLATPMLTRRTGLRVTGTLAMTMVGSGLVIRALAGPLVVLGGTLIAATGIAVASVLLPAVIKTFFPTRIGPMTGTYTATLQGGAAIGFGLTPALAVALDSWRLAWASWSVLALVALVVWAAATRNNTAQLAIPTKTGRPSRAMVRSSQAWIVTAFFGLQALVAFVVIGWLPQLLMQVGVSRATAGLMLALLSVIAVPISLVVPPIAARQASQSSWTTGFGICTVSGVIGLLVAPSLAPLLWTVLLGIGMSVFSLALTTVALRAPSDGDTMQLSGMAQGFGYLLAGTGPFCFGILNDLTHSWTMPLIMLLGVLALQLITGVLAGRPHPA